MLPELPKQNKKKEADFGVIFRKWWNEHKMLGTFEIKDTRGRSLFQLRELHEKQRIIGRLSSGDGVLIRVTLGTSGAGDYIGLIKFPTWVVIKYPTEFYIIPLLTLLQVNTKSLTEKRARELCVNH